MEVGRVGDGSWRRKRKHSAPPGGRRENCRAARPKNVLDTRRPSHGSRALYVKVARARTSSRLAVPYFRIPIAVSVSNLIAACPDWGQAKRQKLGRATAVRSGSSGARMLLASSGTPHGGILDPAVVIHLRVSVPLWPSRTRERCRWVAAPPPATSALNSCSRYRRSAQGTNLRCKKCHLQNTNPGGADLRNPKPAQSTLL